MTQNQLPLLGITAWSGTGKTTLLKKLIPFCVTEIFGLV